MTVGSEWVWPTDKLFRSLCLVLDENDDIPRVNRDIAKRKLRKMRRDGKLVFDNLDDEWVWRLCAAELMQGRYHWFGWEKRSPWAWGMATRPWHYPRWDGTDCELLVIAEQGIGDEILFASCFADLFAACGRVTVEVDDRLLPVMRRSFGDRFVSRWGHHPRHTPRPDSDWRGEHDAFIPAGNVPKLYRRSRGDFPRTPFLVADPAAVSRWREWLSQYPRPWVGVSWRGGGNRREMDPGDLMEPVGTHFNLQYDGTDDRLVRPRDLDLKDDADGVFALIAALDRVNCVPVWVCHVAGSLGVPCNVVRAPKVYGDQNNLLRWEFGRWQKKMDWYGSLVLWPSVGAWNHGKRRQGNTAESTPRPANTG